jgi:glycosyltransferase involved in cell wall biosynthesis
MMRIAVLSAAKSIHTIKWVNSLASRGHTVALFSLSAHKAPYSVINSDVNVYYLKSAGAASYLFGASELKKMLAEFNPDVLSAHYATGYGTLARNSGFKPVLLSVWGSDVYEFPYDGYFYKRIVQKNLSAATSIASTSNAMARQVGRIYHKEKKIFITPFGVDTEKFCPAVRPESDAVTIGIVKTLEPKYGVEYLLRAFSLLNKRLTREGRLPRGGLALEIYGEGSLLVMLQALAAELGVEKQTHFNGQVQHSKVPEVLSSFDIFCAPSVLDSESFGVAAVEAMACGVPVVVSDVDGFKEVVKDRETGFIVPRRDYVMLSNKLAELCVSPALRRQMGEAGRAHVKANYEWRDSVTTMEKALEETIQMESSNKSKRAGAAL